MKHKIQVCPLSLLGAVFFSFCSILTGIYGPYGTELASMGLLRQSFLYVPLFVVLAVIFYRLLFRALNRDYVQPAPRPAGRVLSLLDAHLFPASILVLLAGWAPFAYIYYPGGLPFDSYYQINMATGISPLVNQHPVLSTLFFGFLFSIGRTVNDNFGVFLIVLVQSALSVVVLAFCMKKIRSLTGSIRFTLAALLFFAVVPVWAMYHVVVIKDTNYCCFFLAFTLQFLEALRETMDPDRTGELSLPLLGRLLFWGLLCTLFRHGTLLVFLPALVLLILFARRSRLRIVALTLALAALSTGLNKALIRATNAGSPPVRAAYSIFFMQTARYFRECPEDVSEEEYKVIDRVLTAKVLDKAYNNPLKTDSVKGCYRTSATSAEMAAYFRVWAEMFFKHPRIYLDSFFQFATGYLDPDNPNSPMNVYQNYIKGPPIATGDYQISFVHDKDLLAMADRYLLLWYYTPLLQQLYLPGFYTWLTAFCFLLVWKKGQYRRLIFFILPVLQLGICVASPVSYYIRYSLPVLVITPLMLAWTWNSVVQSPSHPGGAETSAAPLEREK